MTVPVFSDKSKSTLSLIGTVVHTYSAVKIETDQKLAAVGIRDIKPYER